MMRPLAVAALLGAFPALAQQIKTPEELERIRAASRPAPAEWPRPTFSLTPTASIGFGDMGPAFGAGVAFDYAPPVMDKQLLLGIEASWKRPSLTGRYNSYQIDANELGAAAVASFHWYPETSRFAPFVGAGAGLVAMSATNSFLSGTTTRDERELRFAGFGFAGFAFRVGHGALEAQVRFTHSPSRLPMLNSSSILPFSVSGGYRFSL
jgi:hypothetical protein